MTKAELIVDLYNALDVDADNIQCKNCRSLRQRFYKVLNAARHEVLLEENASNIMELAAKDRRKAVSEFRKQITRFANKHL
jgi:hypothetical protein